MPHFDALTGVNCYFKETYNQTVPLGSKQRRLVTIR